MDQQTREQVRLVLSLIEEKARVRVQNQVHRVVAAGNKRGLSNSSVMIGTLVETLEEEGRAFIDAAVDQVSAHAKDIEAFSLISSVVAAFVQVLAAKYDKFSRRALGPSASALQSSGIVGQYKKIWAAAESRLRQQLEIHRFVFVEPQGPQSILKTPQARTDLSPPLKNSGGKPLAKHWDAMWADIATQLWLGDLDPKSQAEVKSAMFDWLNRHGIEAGDTAVTGRARALWTRMQGDDQAG